MANVIVLTLGWQEKALEKEPIGVSEFIVVGIKTDFEFVRIRNLVSFMKTGRISLVKG